MAGCWTKVTRSSKTPAEPRIRCLDCEEVVAVAMPIRVSTAWHGVCTKEGFHWSLGEESETDNLEWNKSSFSDTDDCDRKSYKVDVTCSSECIVYAQNDPAPGSNEKIIAIYPLHAGPLRYGVSMRATGTAKADSPAEHVGGTVIVRAPDFIDSTMYTRKTDVNTPHALFAGYTYDLLPATRHAGPPNRGQRDATTTDPDDTFDRLDRSCFTRAPGAGTWRSCTAGIRPGDDVRIDVLASLAGQPIASDVQLADWTCYRPRIQHGQTCVRYGIPEGIHTLEWTAGASKEIESLPVTGAVGDLDPLSLAAPPPPSAATDVSFDSRETFDSRGVLRGTGMLLAEIEVIGIRDEHLVSPSIVFELPLHERWGALRLGVGGFESETAPSTLRFISGWELPIGCLAYRLCLGVAADIGYSWTDQVTGILAVPHAVLDLRFSDLIVRFGAGPSYVLGTTLEPGQQRHELGYVLKISAGFARAY